MKKIYLNEIEAKGEELIRYSKNDINTKIEELKDTTKNFVWQGTAYDTFMKGYNAKINKMTELNNNMAKIAEYLLRVKDDYANANEKIENAYNEFLDEVNKVRGV